MNRDDTNLLAFLVGLIIAAALLLPGATYAAVNLSPSVPGYAGGHFAGAAGSFTMTAANDGFVKQAVINVGGKATTVPATLRMASNAGAFVKSAIRLNPYLIAGTLALAYLSSNDVSYQGGERMVATSPLQNGAGAVLTTCSVIGDPNPCAYQDMSALIAQHGYSPIAQLCYNSILGGQHGQGPSNGYCVWDFNTVAERDAAVSVTYQPLTLAQWDALPDPLPDVAPELPYAPYLPGGVPVDAPEYEFAPFSVPIGDPYTKPDGSTAQPSAAISPNGDSVTVDTYDQPLTDAQGQPVVDPQPVDTPEPQPDQCQKYPDSIGCAELGTVGDLSVGTESRSISVITPVSIGGVGSCPEPLTASFMGQPIVFSYDMPCNFATSLKPLILALAWLSAGLIFIGGVRQ